MYSRPICRPNVNNAYLRNNLQSHDFSAQCERTAEWSIMEFYHYGKFLTHLSQPGSVCI